MRFRLPLLGVILATAALAARPMAAPVKPLPHASPAAPKPASTRIPGVNYINDVPDTGQFLPDTTLLVRVGPRSTAAGEFVRQYFDAYPEFRPAMDSLGLVQFMNSLVNHQVLRLTARAIGKPLEFADRAIMREHEQRVLSNMIFQRLVVDSVHVSDETVKELQSTINFEGRFRHILFEDRTIAESVRRSLIGGRLSWTEAVKRFTRATGDLGPDGDIGWLGHAKLPPELDVPLYQLKPGEISGVISDRAGFHLAQMTERRKVESVSPEAFHGVTRRALEVYYASQRAVALRAKVRASIGLTYDSTNVRHLASTMQATVAIHREGFATTVELSPNEPDLLPADTALTLARWKDGGQLSVGELMRFYTSTTPLARPSMNYPEAVVNQIDALVLEPYHAQLARELGLDKDPLAIAKIETRREELMVDQMYQDSVMSKVYVSKEERRAYYEQNKPKFFTYASVDFAAFNRHSRASAESLQAALRKGARPEDVLLADSLRGQVTGSLQHRRKDDVGSYHKILFEELHPGDVTIAGPDRNGDFAVIKLQNYDPGRQLSYGESEGMADESAQNIKAEALLDAMLDRLRPRYPIMTRPELVMRLRMADPTASH